MAPDRSTNVPWFLREGGVSGETARAVDWHAAGLGAPEGWPPTLKTTLATMFRARQPMFLWWGPDLIQFYNDGYLPSFGRGKHPRAMGQRGRECWREIWPIIGPQIDDVMERARSSYNEDALVPIFRNGRIEEVYWTYTYSPVFEQDGAVAGTLVICTETTNRVLGERRTNLLHALVGETSVASDGTTLSARAFEVLGHAPADIPFAALYEARPDCGAFEVLAAAGLPPDVVTRLGARLDEALPDAPGDGAWLVPMPDGVLGTGESPSELYVTLLSPPGDARREHVVFGLSPQLPFDDSYRRFLEQITAHLRQAKTRLDEAAGRAAVELEREGLLRELEAANRAKDEFLAMLGHELRNPLSPIVTALRLMRLKTDNKTTVPEQEIIERQVLHLVRLVDDLLDVARIARGQVELRREIVDVADVVSKAVEMASDLLERRHHRLKVTCERGRFTCNADPVRLAQVIANLLTNAAKYTAPRGHVSLDVSLASDEIVITVADDGIGISAEMLPRVFNLFEQARPSSEGRDGDRAAGGLGIGLALVKNLVALHGGTVVARSGGIGKGSEFTVHVPAALGAPAPGGESRPAAATVRAPHAKRILVVDDNVDAAEILAESLELAGHHVEVANEPLAALEIAWRFAPEVAVLDIGLPVIDGYELAKRLRAVAGTEACRMIALTGYGQEHDRQRSRDAGFQRHLVKPFDVDRLIALVEDSG